MNQIVYEIESRILNEAYQVSADDSREIVEKDLILQCAPLIAGLKTSNLFIISNKYVEQAIHLLEDTSLSYYILLATNRKTTILVYEQHSMEQYLAQASVRKLLLVMGYQNMTLSEMIPIFQVRYSDYMSGVSRQFPHEMGFFLGYPVEDVVGFIYHEGQNSLYTGYWKVYDNLNSKVRLFQRFEEAKNMMLELCSNGTSITDVIHIFKDHQITFQA